MSSLRETLNDLLSVTVDDQIERIARMAVVGFANQTLAPELAELIYRVLDDLPHVEPKIGHTVMWGMIEGGQSAFLIGEIVEERVNRSGEVPKRECRIKVNPLITAWKSTERLYVIK